MTVWNDYPNVSDADLRALVAVTAQVLLESDAGASLPPDLLQQSTLATARSLQSQLSDDGLPIAREQIQAILEDDELSTRVAREILDQVRSHPTLAAKVAEAFEARQRKMTGVELVLLTGALMVLAMRIKRIKWGGAEKEVEFEQSGDAVKAFVTNLVKTAGSL